MNTMNNPQRYEYKRNGNDITLTDKITNTIYRGKLLLVRGEETVISKNWLDMAIIAKYLRSVKN